MIYTRLFPESKKICLFFFRGGINEVRYEGKSEAITVCYMPFDLFLFQFNFFFNSFMSIYEIF